MAERIRKNDLVIVRSGKDKGKEGKVIMIMSNSTALVEGINISTKHVKASTGAKQTGLVQQESPIHISNLIFKSGLSTADNVSLISGRGVGMDAVLELITKKGAGVELNLLGKKNSLGCNPFEIIIKIPIFKPLKKH